MQLAVWQTDGSQKSDRTDNANDRTVSSTVWSKEAQLAHDDVYKGPIF